MSTLTSILYYIYIHFIQLGIYSFPFRKKYCTNPVSADTLNEPYTNPDKLRLLYACIIGSKCSHKYVTKLTHFQTIRWHIVRALALHL